MCWSGPAAPEDREDRPAGVLEIRRHGVTASQTVLHRDVLRVRVTHKGDEEQAGVETSEAVAAVAEVQAR